MKVIIYGLDRSRKVIERNLRGNCEIVGYCDDFYRLGVYSDKNLIKLDEIKDTDFDYIIISSLSENRVEEINNKLIKAGIEKNKILKFFSVYKEQCTFLLDLPLKRSHRILSNMGNDIEGIILGISHGAIDINPKYLDKKFCNLAMPMQDLYYNLKQLKTLVYEYPEKAKNIKYAIIDMYTYTYFNYDISMTNNAVLYYENSGYREDEKHNFDNNKNFTGTIQEELDKRQEMYEKNQKISLQDKDKMYQLEIFNKLFDRNTMDVTFDYKDINIYKDYCVDFPLRKDREKIISDEEIEELKRTETPSSLQTFQFSKTLAENRTVFREILKLLNEINENIKIYLVLIPEYNERELYLQKQEKFWKESFYRTLEIFRENFKFTVLDFKDYKELYANRDYYYDSGHLNYKGSVEFTELLNNYIDY
ncbi:hypothetical protein CM240_3193 [Clostridium bornimense]|uniref:Uncharacterized protein n=1 Tax=Clostridium bornimense TaxID=1216932 RepID=W6SKD3_9CLOT|nr:SGNH/GDSL hydrolase family protein [Clostridium bornimense]CDM70310.1 hypothetical protein CM240_3193 [Clostridium bornimense]